MGGAVWQGPDAVRFNPPQPYRCLWHDAHTINFTGIIKYCLFPSPVGVDLHLVTPLVLHWRLRRLIGLRCADEVRGFRRVGDALIYSIGICNAYTNSIVAIM